MATIIILSLVLILIFTALVFLVVKKTSHYSIPSIQTLLKQGKAESAVEPLKKMISKEPKNVDTHFLLAKAYMQQEKPELAFMEIKTINKIGGFSLVCPEKEFRQLSAKLYMQFNQHEEALKDYVMLIKLLPYESLNYYNVGVLFEERNKSSKAVNYYKKTIELDPRHAGAYLHLGIIMFNSKRMKEAKFYLDQSIKYDDNNFISYFYLGKIAKEMKDYANAINLLEKSLRDKTIKLKALIERGICFILIQKYELAIGDLEKAINMEKSNSSEKTSLQQMLYARYFIARAYEQLRDLDKAIEHWSFIDSKKKNFKDVSEKLAQYKELQENDSMKDYLTSNQSDFIEICKKICVEIKITPQDIKTIKGGIQLVGVESGKKDWKVAKKMPFLIRFLRNSSLVSEAAIRGILDEMKNLSITKGILISSTEISNEGKKFAESRPLDMIGKRKLIQIMKQMKQM